MLIHTLSRKEVFQALDSSEGGLTDEDAKGRLRKYGPNILAEPKKTPVTYRFLAQFKNLFAVLLLIASVLAYLVGMPELGIAIVLIVVINATVGFLQEYRAEKASEALKRFVPFYARVLRNGEHKKVHAPGLVPGDLIILEEGDRIPADARLIEAFDMTTNHMALTGESEPQPRLPDPVPMEMGLLDAPNVVFMGTSVASGSGKAVVFATGMNTEFGEIARLTQVIEEEPSPLQKEITRAAKFIAVIAMAIGVLFFSVGLFMQISLFSAFLFGLGVVVAMIPEGLQATVSVALAMGVERMARRHALIKRLSAVETLGCTTVICTDKTGTITKGEMTVTQIGVDNRTISVTGVGYEPSGDFIYEGRKMYREEVAGLGLLLEAVACCNTARIIPPSDKRALWGIMGDPTEGALLVVAQKGDLNLKQILAEKPRHHLLPFDSQRKRMSSIHRHGNKLITYVKGAPYEILSLSTHEIVNGSVRALSEERMEAINTQVDDFAKAGLRVLAVAYRELPPDLQAYTAENTETRLIFIGLVAMLDPPRTEVKEAVRKVKQAGIKTIMITGDYGITARAIAKQVEMVENDDCKVFTGTEIDQLSDDELSKELDRKEVIFARATPEHKLRIVTLLKMNGEIVAVTGDGANDAPSLKMADIGVAMGIAGTDVARESADMILLDDSFATIVAAIEEGRAVYDNIKKFTTYIISSNWPELIPFIAYVLLKIPLALMIMQLLAIDLGTDLLPALALGVDPPEPGIMTQPPRGRGERLLNLSLFGRSLFLGAFECIGSMVSCLHTWMVGGWRWGLSLALNDPLYRKGTTMTFAGIVATQVGNVFACRTTRNSIFKVGFFKNKWVFAGILGELCITASIIYLPPLQTVFNTAPLGLGDWAFLFMFAPILFFSEEIRKFVLRRFHG